MTGLDILSLGVHNCLHAAGHGVDEGGEELLLPVEDLPGARYLLGKVVQVFSGLHSRNDLLELPPEVFNWVEVTTLTNSVQNWDICMILEPGGDKAGSVARQGEGPCPA